MDKEEYPPLLEIGMHEMSLVELRKLCVEAFPLSHTRENVMSAFEALYNALSGQGIESEVWVDGSFLTKKINPDDSDIVVKLMSSAYDSLTNDQQEVLDRVSKQKFCVQSRCDSYFFIEYPKNHDLHWVGEDSKAYWLKQFGFSRQKQTKGFALLKTPLS